MTRANWYADHPPACTCVRCSERRRVRTKKGNHMDFLTGMLGAGFGAVLRAAGMAVLVIGIIVGIFNFSPAWKGGLIIGLSIFIAAALLYAGDRISGKR